MGKQRKKTTIAFLSIIIVIIFVMLVNEGYAFFLFGTDYFKNVDVGVDEIYASNTSFDDDDDSYYKVYFFASPYYATGSGKTPSSDEDPLTIANSGSNPYNDATNTYCTIASKGNNFSNAFFENNSTGYYITYKNKNVEYLTGNYGDLEFFNVRDFTGYIRANEDLKIAQTYTYVCAEFKGSISSEYLSGIIAATEFKDGWGFGPEFIGWTYDKGASFNRTVYKGSSTDNNQSVRYSKELKLYTCDSGGNGYGGTIAEEIGNYGVQGKIEQVTSETSLEYLDSLDADGSQKGDHIIYLYPVFAAKNYSSGKMFYDNIAFGNSYAPMIKFRVNPGDSYQTKQSDEIDYEKNRYTTCLFMEELNNQKTNANYSTGNFYIDKDDKIQLDFDDWSGNWKTILEDKALDALGLENGYYNIDLTFWYGSGGTTSTENAYKDSNKYLKILSGTVTSGGGKTCCYVIGFQKVEDFYLNVYDAEGSTAVKTADLRITPEIENTLYYVVDNVYLTAGQVLSFSNSNITSIGKLNGDNLSRYNNKNNQKYLTPGGNAATDTQGIKLIDNKISVSISGHYSFLVLLGYEDGIPASATIAYKENDVKYHFIVYEYDDIYDGNGNVIDQTVFLDAGYSKIYASYEGSGNSYLNWETSLMRKGENNNVTIEKIYKTYVLVDTATGCEIPYSVFENNAFYLNRSYVLYLKEKEK